MGSVLVTGGAGFIGSHLCERLEEAGRNIVCLDNFDDFYDPASKRRNVRALLEKPGFTLVEGDFRDASLLDSLFGHYRIESVVHLGARAGVRPSMEFPLLYEDINIRGTLQLLEAMKRHSVRKLVFASSSSVYGAANTVPFGEYDRTDHPLSPYAASKKAGELLVFSYFTTFGLDATVLRFFTAYGPRQRPEMAIHKFTRQIDVGEEIQLFGDGSTRRDYTYVADIIQGVVAAEERCSGFQLFNLGESKTIGLMETVALIEERLGKKAKIRFLPEQPGEMRVTCADIARARERLGYAPRVDLPEGIDRFVTWYQESKK